MVWIWWCVCSEEETVGAATIFIKSLIFIISLGENSTVPLPSSLYSLFCQPLTSITQVWVAPWGESMVILQDWVGFRGFTFCPFGCCVECVCPFFFFFLPFLFVSESHSLQSLGLILQYTDSKSQKLHWKLECLVKSEMMKHGVMIANSIWSDRYVLPWWPSEDSL